MPKRRASTKRRSGKPSRRRGRPRWRTVAALSVAFAVLFAAGLVYLQVTLSHRFDGRLWALPSRVYSSELVLRDGDRVSPSGLTRRLDRAGYRRNSDLPDRAGQYRQRGERLEIHLRPFRKGDVETRARLLRLRFLGDRVVAVTDQDGARAQAVIEPELLATLFGPRQEERQLVRLGQVPQVLLAAVLAAEDARFFSHHGLDLRGILRAASANVRQRKIVQGGSTITQQTVKNLFLGQERTWWRKSREAVMALLLDRRYSKQRILEVYLNEVYLGQRGPVAICGVQAAARFYFGRDVGDLSLGESAMLAGLIRSPGRYNPFVHPERAAARRDQILDAVERLGLVDGTAVTAARGESLALASGGGGYAGAPYAVDFVRAQVAELYSVDILFEDGLQIYTTVDTVWQEHAERALDAGLKRLDREAPEVRRQVGQRALQGALLVMQPESGAILAMVGGRDYAASQFNRAVQARRQPGSCFKPFVYAAGFEQAMTESGEGLTPATVLDDSPLELVSGGRTWRPANHDRDHRGPVTVRQSLEQSLNVPTVRAARHVGLDAVIESAHRCGIESRLAAVPSLALGTEEVTPLELATAYATLARSGEHVSPWIVREVIDRNGHARVPRKPKRSRAISAEAVYLVNDILQGVLRRGTARSAASLGYHGHAAGKTGTTDDTRDAWFVGYTPRLLALTWVGYDDNARTGLTGSTAALPIWTDLMNRGSVSPGPRHFPKPRGIVERRIDPQSGELALRGCPTWVDEHFVRGSEPTRPCLLHDRRFRRWFRKLVGQRSRAPV